MEFNVEGGEKKEDDVVAKTQPKRVFGRKKKIKIKHCKVR